MKDAWTLALLDFSSKNNPDGSSELFKLLFVDNDAWFFTQMVKFSGIPWKIMRGYGINWRPRVLALAEDEMTKPNFHDFDVDGPFVYFFEHLVLDMSFSANECLLKEELMEIGIESTDDSCDTILRLLPQYLQNTHQVGELCWEIHNMNLTLCEQYHVGKRLIGRAFACCLKHTIQKYFEEEYDLHKLTYQVARIFVKVFVSNFPTKPGELANKELAESAGTITVEDGELLNNTVYDIEIVLKDYFMSINQMFIGRPRPTVLTAVSHYKDTIEEDGFKKICKVILANAEELAESLGQSHPIPKEDFPSDLIPQVTWDCGAWMKLRPSWQHNFFYRWLNARALFSARKCARICRSESRWDDTENAFQKQYVDGRGLTYVMSALGKGNYYNARPSTIASLLFNPASRMGLDPWICDIAHIETIEDVHREGDILIRHQVCYIAWEMPNIDDESSLDDQKSDDDQTSSYENLDEETPNTKNSKSSLKKEAQIVDSVVVISTIEGLVCRGVEYCAVTANSVPRPIPRMQKRTPCRLYHDDFIIYDGPEADTSKIWRIQAANFGGERKSELEMYCFLRQEHPLDALTRMVSLVQAVDHTEAEPEDEKDENEKN